MSKIIFNIIIISINISIPIVVVINTIVITVIQQYILWCNHDLLLETLSCPDRMRYFLNLKESLVKV